MSEPEQPRTPNWWVPSADREAPDAGFAPLDEATGVGPQAPPPPAPTNEPMPVSPDPYASPYAQPYGYGPGYAPPSNNAMAVASLVCGIVSLIGGLICFFGALAAVPGLVLGIVGLNRINRSNGMEKAKGMAIAGIVTSAVGLVVLGLLFLVYGLAANSDSF
jgi:hypothetical protein